MMGTYCCRRLRLYDNYFDVGTLLDDVMGT